MARTLDVYLHDKLGGYLTQDDDGQMLFEYAESWLEGPEALPISQSLPLRTGAFKSKECRGFFAGILPEADKRDVIARNLGISAKNDYAMLAKIGGECAGAITFMPSNEPFPESRHEYRRLSDANLAQILKDLPRHPLMAGEEGVRLSLAGAQDKIAVHLRGHEISVPLGGAPSTHIIKPAIERFEGIVFNEAVCMTLSARIGLQTSPVWIRNVEGIDYLLIERYDREMGQAGEIRRLHQEDFCQALAIVPEKKYQNEGGPSLRQCFDLLRSVSKSPAVDLGRLLDAVIFNVLIGNNDAHAKNYSLLYGADYSIRLAPLYDVICTVHYPELAPHMAMKIGKESLSEHLLPKHFGELASESGLAKPLVLRRVPELANNILSRLPTIEMEHDIAHKVKAQIKERCESFLARFKK